MKKFLSLVLALVMMMSLVTINAGAKEFADDADVTYDEAVAVISEIGVVDGDTNGNFRPTDGLTRGAAAKIICNLILGPTTAAELHADTAPFKDVPISNTFSGYIAYCAKEGIISGYADGAFRPANPLTGYAFMKMLLGALGYDANYEQYVGENWAINVAKQALGIGLNAGLEDQFNGVDYVTREEAALYAFNTLTATLVDYDTKITTNINGTDVTIGNTTAKPVSANNQNSQTGLSYDGNIKDDDFVQFAEQYFTKLYLNKTVDVFGRPSRQWEFGATDIGTYVNHSLLKEEYTVKVTGKELYDLLGKNIVDEYDTLVTIDGETTKAILDKAFFSEENIIRTNTEGVGATGKGVLTQVYVDADTKDVYIAIINTYLAIANDDYNEKKDEVTFEVYGVNEVGTGSAKALVKDTSDQDGTKDGKQASTEMLTVKGEDFDIKEIVEDQIVLVNVAENEIKVIGDVEALEDVTITRFKNQDYVTSDGTDYNYASTALYDPEVLDQYVQQNMKETSYNIYLDPYGYLIGIDIVEEVNKYLFLSGIQGSLSNLYNKTADANVILLDGTMDTVKVNMAKSEKADGTALEPAALLNTWCTYTVGKDGVYTLTQVADHKDTFENSTGGTDKVGQGWQGSYTEAAADVLTIDKKHVTLDGVANTSFKRVYANENSTFLTVDVEKITADRISLTNQAQGPAVIISDVDSVATNVQTVSLNVWNANKVLANNTDITGVPAANVSNGVYTLFKDNGYVIAAVVVGEDDGSTTNYAYVTSASGYNGMKQEAYDSATEEYTWTRDVVVNGEIVELTETSDGSEPEIADMDRNAWYEVKYLADGTVRRVTKINADNANTTAEAYEFYTNAAAQSPDPKFIGLIEKVEKSVEDNDTVVLFENLTSQPYKLSSVANTLQVDTATALVSRGFAVAPSAKIVLVQDEIETRNGVVDPASVKPMENKYEYDNGTKGLEKALKDLEDNNNFRGYIGAVIENGLATSVVIYDNTAFQVEIGGGSTQTGNIATMYDDNAFSVGDKKLKGSSANGSFYIDSVNRLVATVDYTAPEWVPAGAQVTLTLPVEYYDMSTATNLRFTGTLNADKEAKLMAMSNPYDFISYPEVDKLSLGDLTVESFSAVNVYYKDSTGADISGKLSDAATNATTRTLAATGSNNIVVKLLNSSAGNLNTTVAQPAGTTGGSTVTPAPAYSALNSGTNVWTGATATGAAPVIVTLDISNLANAYSVNAGTIFQSGGAKDGASGAIDQTAGAAATMDEFGLASATTDTLLINWDAATYADGVKVQFTATVAGKTDAYAYDITIKTNIGDVEIKNVSNTNKAGWTSEAVTGNVVINDVVVTVAQENLKKLADADVTVSNDKMIINFSEGVNAVSGGNMVAIDEAVVTFTATPATLSVVDVTHSLDGDQVTITFNRPLTNSDNVTFAKADIHAAYDQAETLPGDNTNVILTVGAASTVTVTYSA